MNLDRIPSIPTGGMAEHRNALLNNDANVAVVVMGCGIHAYRHTRPHMALFRAHSGWARWRRASDAFKDNIERCSMVVALWISSSAYWAHDQIVGRWVVDVSPGDLELVRVCEETCGDGVNLCKLVGGAIGCNVVVQATSRYDLWRAAQ